MKTLKTWKIAGLPLGMLIGLVIGAAGLLPVGHASAAEKNIIFIISDDQSPLLGCYGDPVAVTPHLDALAKDGTLFRNAFATTASCSPSRAVVLTGVHHHLTGQYGLAHAYHHYQSFPNLVSLSLPLTLKQNNYRTAIIGKLHVNPNEVYKFDEVLPGNPRNAVAMADQCRKFITKDDSQPFMIYFAPADPHRGAQVDQNSRLNQKPNLFGNKPNREAFPKVNEVFYDPAKVPVPSFLPDTPQTREELAQYYQSCSRVDQGVGQLVKILKEAGLYDKTLIAYTSDHGIAMQGAKTTQYDAGLHVPFIVRNPYEKSRGIVSNALISHVDITPSLLDFAEALDREKNAPKNQIDANKFWKDLGQLQNDNRSGGFETKSYSGKSWVPILGDANASHHLEVYGEHTAHEVYMYYPMRSVRDHKYKLIWNIASELTVPSASDLWGSSTWQTQYLKGPHAKYGQRTVQASLKRDQFELFDLEQDPHESINLALDPHHAPLLKEYQERLKTFQEKTGDPWILKWDRE